MSDVEHLLAITAIMTVLLTIAGALALRLAARQARRLLARTARSCIDRARSHGVLGGGRSTEAGAPVPAAPASTLGLHKVISSGRLRTRALLPGATHEIDRLRYRLLTDVRGTVKAIRLGEQTGRPLVGLGSIAARLEGQAHALDTDLAVIAAEPDRVIRQTLLAAQQDRVTGLRHSCRQLRHGVLLAGHSTSASVRSVLTDELNEEVLALHLRAQAFRELSDVQPR
ncbi:MAG: hypothetical protein NVSMB55_26570 [Mycobacteriales bacterium]